MNLKLLKTRLLTWTIAAVGLLVAIWGLAWCMAGWGSATSERAMAGMTSGAMLFGAGAIVAALAVAIARLEAMAAAICEQTALLREIAGSAAPAGYAEAREDAPANHEPAQAMQPVAPAAAAVAATAAAVAAVTAAVAPEPQSAPAASLEPEPAAAEPPPAAESVAEVQIAAVEAAPEHTALVVVPPPPPMPEAAPQRSGAPSLKVVDGGRSAQIEDLNPKPPAAPPASALLESVTTIERTARRATVPVPPLAPAPAGSDWPDAPNPKVVAATATRPPAPKGPPMPAGALAAAAPAPAKSSFEDDIAALAKGGSAQAAAVAIAAAPAVPAREAPQSDSPAWVEKLFQELDQFAAPEQSNDIETMFASSKKAPPEEEFPIDLSQLTAPPRQPPQAPVSQPQAVPEIAAAPEPEAVAEQEVAEQEVEAATESALPAEAVAESAVEETQPEPAGVAEVHSQAATDAPAEVEGVAEAEEAEDAEPSQPAIAAAAEPEHSAPIPAPYQPSPSRTLVRNYEAQGVHYFLYDDGSIDAETTGGTFNFASLDELRTFIEKRRA